MISKKKIIAIALFIIIGFGMFTFANPSEDVAPLTEASEKNVEEVSEEIPKEEDKKEDIIVTNVVDNAPVINVFPAVVKVLEGTEYDIKNGVTVIDDKDDNLNIMTSLVVDESQEKLIYNITYTVVDSSFNTSTAIRTMIILSNDADEDNDNYTNLEEYKFQTNFDDANSYPIDLEPILTFENDLIEIEYATKYDVMDGVEVSDDFDTLDDKLKIIFDITDTSNLTVGEYTITYRVTDRNQNETLATRKIKVVDTTSPVFNLVGDKKIVLEAAVDNYEEIGAKAIDLVDGEFNVQPEYINYSIDGEFISKVNSVDTKKVGTYKIVYTCFDKAGNKCIDENKNSHDYIIRTVEVVDTISPVIKINGNSKLILEAFIDNYEEIGVKATDLLDGEFEITPEYINYSVNGKFIGKVDKVDTEKLGTYKVVYTCSDKAGNKCVDENKSSHEYIIRTVEVVDTTSPTIKLNGDAKITLESHVDNYEELGAKATDLVDGEFEITPEYINYSVNGKFIGKVDKVDTEKLGTYKIQYTCSDKAGNKCVDENRTDHEYIIRVVEVVDTTKPIFNGIIDNEVYVNELTYSINEANLEKVIIDGKEYSIEDIPYTLTEKGNHTITAVDKSLNETTVNFTIIHKVNLTFKDYNDEVLLETSIEVGTDATSIAPIMTDKSYVKNHITYTFTSWDNNITTIENEMIVKAIYGVSKVEAVAYVLNDDVERPVNGAVSIGGTKDYKKIGLVELNLNDIVKEITNQNVKKVVTTDTLEVLNYVKADLLPNPIDSEEKFTKYEWYVLKYETDGWHIDGQVVVDEDRLNTYRENSIEEIKQYALEIGFDIESEEIMTIINVSDINNLVLKSSIDEAKLNAKSSIDSLFTATKNTVKDEINSNNVGFNELYIESANEIIKQGSISVDSANNISELNDTKNQVIDQLNSLKELMNTTFDLSIVDNGLSITGIASDVVVTKVVYDYLIYSDKEVYIGDSYQNEIYIDEEIDEFYRDVNKVRVEYTKKNENYFAKYEITYSFGKPESIKVYYDGYKK